MLEKNEEKLNVCGICGISDELVKIDDLRNGRGEKDNEKMIFPCPAALVVSSLSPPLFFFFSLGKVASSRKRRMRHKTLVHKRALNIAPIASIAFLFSFIFIIALLPQKYL